MNNDKSMINKKLFIYYQLFKEKKLHLTRRKINRWAELHNF